MKKLTMLLLISGLILVGCGDKKKDEAPKTTPVKTEKKSETVANVAEGKNAFASSGCTACHNETAKIIGPAIKDIASAYSENSGDLLAFLKGTADAIVDTDPTQVAIMKNNIDTMVKNISDEDLANIVAYIESVK